MKNVRRTPYGYQLYTRVAGKFVSEHVSTEPPALAVRDWVRQKHVEARYPIAVPPPADGPTIGEDVTTYLALRAGMPSIQDRTLHLNEWAAVFAGRGRASITALEIRQQLERWRVDRRYANSTLEKRRTALMSLWTALDGKSGRNPVRDVPTYPEDEGEPRALDYGTIYRLLALMRPSKTRARLRVLAWTGWPHAQVMRLKPEHVSLKQARAWVSPRRKGKGRKGRWLPLLPPAVTALTDFDRWDCWGPFSASSMHSRFALAVKKLNARRARAGRRPIQAHPYDLRHSFGTMLAALLKDERAVQELLLHSTPQQTRRYIEAATAYRIESAVSGALETFALGWKVARNVASRDDHAESLRKSPE